MINPPLLQKVVRFVIVGTLGFLTDAGFLWLASEKIGLDPYSGRLISFLCALLVTWLLNSTFTFKSTHRPSKRQFGSFGLNYAIYSALVWLDAVMPIPALIIASLIAMFYSFTAMNIWVFKEPHT